MNDEEKLERRLTLQVSVQIIKHISSGLYRSPASALKELISNSFDADAHKVTVEFNFSYDKAGTIFLDSISVGDDGSGMDLRTLEYVFTHIGGSSKESSDSIPKTPEGRDIIGRLGIGMLSVASACKSFIVRTKKKNEEREYSADISLSFFDDLRELTETMDKFSIGNVKITSRSKPGFEQYTIIEISDFKPPFLDNILDNILESYFFQEPIKTDQLPSEEEGYQNYFIGFLDRLSHKEKLLSMPVLDQIIATVGLMSPVEYLQDGPVRSKVVLKDGTEHIIPGTDDPNYISIKEKLKSLNFTVFCKINIDNKTEGRKTLKEFKIYKPLLYPNERDLIDNRFEDLDPYVHNIEPISAEIENEPGKKINTLIRGYAYHQNVRVLPHEYRGLLFRVYNVAIGDYFRDELRLYSEDPVVLHQLMVEVYLDHGFHSIVNLDRESLYEGARTYQYLRAFLDKLFKGKAPNKPPEPPAEPGEPKAGSAVSANLEKPASVNRDVIFYNNLDQLLKNVSGKGIISDIKVRMKNQRNVHIKTRDPSDKIKSIAKDMLNVKDVRIEYTKKLEDFGLVVIDNEKKDAIINVPKFAGSRAKMWESIFAAAAIWGPPQQEDRKRFMETLYSIYETTEGK